MRATAPVAATVTSEAWLKGLQFGLAFLAPAIGTSPSTTNPWSNEIFFRSLCRRFFRQDVNNTNQATTRLPAYQGNETIAQVTQSLTGVLFLEDKSITAPNPLDQNVKGFAYFNPNATHRISRHFREHLSVLGFFADDFQHDNY